MFRYQDDCIVFNNENAFNHIFILMYPSEMVLKCTNISPAKSTFLDLTICVIVGNTSTSPMFETVNGNKAHAYGMFIS